MKQYSKEEIYDVIPNRYPLMVLDKLSIDTDTAVSEFLLKSDDWFLECHYPGRPIMPLSVLLECMTQTFSAIFLHELGTGEIPVISKIGELKMLDSATIGDMIQIEAKMSSFKRGIAKGKITANKILDTEGEIKKKEMLETDIIEVVPSLMTVPREI